MRVASLSLLPLVRSGGVLPRQMEYGYCKETSFSQPQWYLWDQTIMVVNKTTEGTFGSFGVGVQNSASGEAFVCFKTGINLAPPTGSGQWHDCDLPGAQFRMNLTASTLELRQDWVCADEPTVKFSASGTVILGGDKWCDAGEPESGVLERCILHNTDLIPYLSSPVRIHPYVPMWPWMPYEYPKGCADRSASPLWQLDGLVYTQTGTSATQSLSFNLTNVSNGGKVACTVALDNGITRSTAYAERWLECSAKDGSPGDISATRVMYNPDYGLLGIKQDWKCRDGGPTTFNGLGYLSAPLQCAGVGKYTADAVDATCSLPSTNITGYASADIPRQLPHTSYVRSCTMYSLNTTSMVLKSFEIDSSAGKTDTASFVIYNPGPGDDYALRGIQLQDDGLWHACASGAKSLPWQLASCEYLFNRESRNIGFRLRWHCDDRDPFHPIIFNATASGQLPSGDGDAKLSISALSWASTDQPMDKGPLLPWV